MKKAWSYQNAGDVPEEEVLEPGDVGYNPQLGDPENSTNDAEPVKHGGPLLRQILIRAEKAAEKGKDPNTRLQKAAHQYYYKDKFESVIDGRTVFFPRWEHIYNKVKDVAIAAGRLLESDVPFHVTIDDQKSTKIYDLYNSDGTPVYQGDLTMDMADREAEAYSTSGGVVLLFVRSTSHLAKNPTITASD